MKVSTIKKNSIMTVVLCMLMAQNKINIYGHVCCPIYPSNCLKNLSSRSIDLMHMKSQKGAPAYWGTNDALSGVPSPSMQPAGQPLHAIPPGRPGPAHWPRGWERQRSSSTTRARSSTSLDPQHGVIVMETWRQCITGLPTLDEGSEWEMRGPSAASL